MKLEDQVCTLEQSKKLHELGIECNSLWVWKVNNTQSVVVERKMGEWATKYAPMVGNTLFPAFTVSELGVMIPDDYLRGDIDKDYKFGVFRGIWKVDDNFWGERQGYKMNCNFHETEAKARASLLIYLIEEDISTPQQCNERLIQ